MAFTRILGPGIHTASNINSHNIKSTGIITAVSFVGDGSGLTGIASTDNIVTGTAATFNTYPVDINAGMTVAGVSSFSDAISGTTANFSGNVTVGGVLTYEDVKNVDSVGLVTAREGIFIPDNKDIRLGGSYASPAFRIFSNGTHQYIRDIGSGNLYLTTNSLNVLNSSTSETLLKATQGANGYVQLYQNNQVKLQTTSTGAVVTGILTATHFSGSSEVGIQSAGTQIGAGITQLNFVGAGNTFAVNGTTVDISIAGGGGGSGAGFSTSNAGLHTTSSIGLNTSSISDAVTGVGNSFQGIYVSNGMMIMDNTLNGNHYIGTAFNGLMAGPVNINGTLSIDGNYVVV